MVASVEESKAVEVIQTFEKVFLEAGKLSLNLRQNLRISKKVNSGIKEIDTVTNADEEIQELILKAFLKSSLSRCRLLAEETTPSVNSFNNQGDLFLTIDPIDGTAAYAVGEKVFSIIIGLHNKQEPLYTFAHYPALNWTHKIVEREYTMFGERPSIKLLSNGEKVIVYSSGNPSEFIPDLFNKFINEGYIFQHKRALTNDSGSTTLLLAGKVAGYYGENPLAIDGLVALHYALSRGLRLYWKGVDDNEMDLSVTETDSYGSPRYLGYYLAIAE